MSRSLARLAMAAAAATGCGAAGAAVVGDPDPRFGEAGVATFDLARGGHGHDRARALLVQPDGAVLFAGTADGDPDGETDVYVARMLPDGRADFSFGTAAITDLDFGDSAGPGLWVDTLRGLARDGQGRILLAGSSRDPGTGATDLIVARLLADGTPDATFGSGGVRRVDLGFSPDGVEQLFAVAVQPDGAIVAAGGATAPLGTALVVLRLHPDGTPDSAFSGDGIAAVTAGSGTPSVAAATDLLVLPDGRLLLAGLASVGSDSAPNTAVLLLCLRPDGSVDPAFGDAGSVLLDVGTAGSGFDTAYALRRLADGRLLVAGTAEIQASAGAMLAARFHANGMLDTSFGTNGVRTVSNAAEATYDVAEALLVLPDGQLVLAGSSSSTDGNADVALAFLTADGADAADPPLRLHALDRSARAADEGHAAALRPDGSLLVAGASSLDGNQDTLLLQLHGVRVFGAGFE